MPRYALKIEYHGKPFVGWQRQTDLTSVQGCIESALRVLEKDHQGIQGAGRTDAGVHATGQVAHLDMATDWDPFRLSEALNFHLKPNPIAITNCARVEDDFHARFTALERTYHFRLIARRAPVTHDEGLVWQVRKPLDLAAMQTGANHLLGRHDFTTFRSTICQADSPVRTLDELSITEHAYEGGTEYHFKIRARSFLHNQVRSFVGTLEHVGSGSWHPGRVRDALDAKDRSHCGTVCPPHGLYLAHVKYPTDPFA
ncbi:tRNA pseudouridine(38-40) synthase TruA [Amylibacter sp. IMCC11727]|uniref:tRNA pseudouridine(38-40) synthase TruA n=1 Tax=Amylibacter sp. IMCC11727 TaxID=3039851 RepID=UPI00244E15AD|nr:tRNA pseudouridine(38-40) synthase TruA [Amylibacter sp. IMCC11727]WGI22583.1 tRNA pseudouridine(38-40) synthase TruA [Amylibacter sp. IMCC11727]